MMTKGIYCYIDKKDDNIVYVGRDSRIHKDKRHKDHYQPSRYNDQVINRVLQNNPDRYTYQVLVFDVQDENTLNALEIQYTRQLQPKFSFTEGGDGTSGFKHSEESKRKMSESKKGKNHPFFRQKRPDFSGENHPFFGQKRLDFSGENHPFYGQKRPKHSEAIKGENNPFYNRKHTEESRRKISKIKSKQRNSTGFYRVSIISCPSCKTGFVWRYQYYTDSQRKSITSIDLNKLKEKVLEKNLEWYIINEENALKSLKKNEEGVKK